MRDDKSGIGGFSTFNAIASRMSHGA